MDSLDNLTNDPNQIAKFVLADGSTVIMNMVYNPAVQRWVMNVLRGTFEVNSINISIHPNFMREWRNIIPFGIGCTTTDGADPVYLDDFANGRAVIHMLNALDVAAVEATYLGAGVA